jgi:large repetitive protein
VWPMIYGSCEDFSEGEPRTTRLVKSLSKLKLALIGLLLMGTWACGGGVNLTSSDPPALKIATTTLPNGTAGMAYSTTLAAAGGTSPYTWSLTAGSLPPALALSASGTISGTPTTAGPYSFTIQAADSAGRKASHAFTVSIALLSITTTSLPNGTAGVAYSATLSAAGGTPPYTWSLTAGSLPPGLALSASGTISGTPTTAGSYSFTIQAADSAGRKASHAFTVSIALLSITTTSLPNGTVGAAYSATLSAAGGTPPYTWSLTAGSLPPGLALSASGSISGTPTTAGSYSFTVQAADTAAGKASQAFSVSIASSLSITTTSLPSGTVGVAYSSTLSATGGTPPYTWSLTAGSLPPGLALSASGSISGTPTTAGSYNFTIQASDSGGRKASQAFTVSIASPPYLSASPTSLSFGNVVVGSSSTQMVTLTNSTSGVTISQIGVSGAGFSASGLTPPLTLPAGQSTTFSVIFGPTTSGSVTGSVSVVSSATNSPTTIALSGTGTTASATVNVQNYGATGNGTTDDTAAINSAIAALTSGATLLFPCGTYLISSQLSINVSNVTIDGGSCAIIHNTASGTVMVMGGSGNGNPNYGPAVALGATANELDTSFTTVSSLGVAAGDYVRLQEGGKDSSTGSGDTGCDPSGCRGEVLKVASVSGNTITVTTALHDTYDPAVNAATAQKILSPLTGVTVKNITFDGNGSNVYGLALTGVAESTVSGVTARNVQGAALLNRGDFNVAWSNITVTGAGSAQCGDAVWFENQGDLSVNGMSISNENPGTGTGCLANGAFGFGLIGSANATLTNLTVDAAGAYGRPFKTTASRWNTFNSLTVKNGVQAYNGISLEYYSSHNTYNNCVVTNNGASTGTGTGNAGINTFGNFNQYNTFNNCTVSGNGNVQILVNNFDALRLGQDSNTTISGGTFTGSNSVEPVIYINGANPYIRDGLINGSGAQGILMQSPTANGCINNNTFGAGTGLGSAISSNSSTNIGSGNTLNGMSSNLSAGTCGASSVAVSISPTAATVTSAGTQQFTAAVTGTSNTGVTWSATEGSVSSSGLFTAPTVSADATVTVTATSQAYPSQAASATVTVTPSAPPNTFGYAVQGASIGATMSNSVSATRYQMAAQNGTVTSMSVFIASPVSASPNNQFQVAIYADNNGAPGALIASSVSATIVPDAWNTVPISAPVAANAYYWLAYNTNGLAANANNLRYDAGGATSAWISLEPFATWPATFSPIGGTSSYRASIYATFQ